MGIDLVWIWYGFGIEIEGYGRVWYGMVWDGMVWYGYGMDKVWYGMVWLWIGYVIYMSWMWMEEGLCSG